MCGMQERKEQTYRDGLNALVVQKGDQRIHLQWVERDQYIAMMIDTLVHFQPPCAFHQWCGRVGAQIIERRPVLASNLQHVAKPLCRDERRGCAFAFQKCVGRHGGAVDDAQSIACDLFGLQPSQDCLRRVGRGGGKLERMQRLGGWIVDHEIGEGAADVDADACAMRLTQGNWVSSRELLSMNQLTNPLLFHCVAYWMQALIFIIADDGLPQVAPLGIRV